MALNRDRFINTDGTFNRGEILRAAHAQVRETIAFCAKRPRRDRFGKIIPAFYAAEFAKSLRWAWAHARIARDNHPVHRPSILASYVPIKPFATKERFSLRPVW